MTAYSPRIRSLECIRNAIDSLRADVGTGHRQGPPEVVVKRMGSLLVEGREELDLFKSFLRECSIKHPNHPVDLHFIGRGDDRDDGGRPNCYQFASVATLMNQIPNQLQTLKFSGIKLEGDSSPLVQALQQQDQLECFSLICSTTMPASGLGALADCLLPLPNLKEIYCDFGALHIPPAAVASFARVTTLESLTLHCQPFNDVPNLQDLFLSMQKHAFLKQVQIHFSLLKENVQHVAQMLRRNQSIQELDICVENTVSVIPIAEALETNSTLKKLNTDAGLWYGNGSRGRQQKNAFLHTLESHNFVLESLHLFHSRINTQDREIVQKINFYLELNKDFRRQRLLSSQDGNASPAEWLDVIVSAENKTKVVFYYLSKNVSLILSANVNCAALAGQFGIRGNHTVTRIKCGKKRPRRR
jgi:hypothetical protein